MQVGGYIGDDIEPDSQTRSGLRMRYLTKLGFIRVDGEKVFSPETTETWSTIP
jgi:hypothetical protein